MPRVRKGAARTQARKKLLRKARGYFGVFSKKKWHAKVAVMTAGVYAYRDRRLLKRDMRSLWITRLTAACKLRNGRYSTFVNGLKLAGVVLNRKMLSELAIHDTAAFDKIFAIATEAFNARKPVTGGLTFGAVGSAASAGAGAAKASSNDIEDIEGIGPSFAKKLAVAGIKTIADLRNAGKSSADRATVANKSGIKVDNINKWTLAADFFRIGGMDGNMAELLVQSGFKTVPALAKADAKTVAGKMASSNKDASGRLISPRLPDGAECSKWISEAKALPAMISE
jgi:large subunit ribosomal protein L20